MTLVEFANIFAALAVQLRFTDADEATIRVYYEPLKTLDLELVQMAAERFATQPGANGEKVWFPGTPEWRGMVAKIDAERRDDQTRRIRERQKAGLPPLCIACDDTGFEPVAEWNRYRRCDCRKLRHLEILGRRPMPALPERLPVPDVTQESRALSLVQTAVKAL